MPVRIDKKFLVIGCGSIGKRHINNLITLGAKDILAFDVKPECRYEVEAQFNLKTLDHLEAAWDYRPDVALVTVPTSLHIPIALQAAQHGYHLFIEKPLSHNLDDVSQLLKIVQEKNLITLVGCNMRFHPGLMKVKQLIKEKVVGQVITARVEFGQYLPDWHPKEDYRQGYSAQRSLGGGVILDVIHEIDYIRWLLGEIVAVVCFAGQLSHLEIETEDIAAILLRFAGGTIGEVHLDYVQRDYSRTCQIIGDEGTIYWDYSAGEVRWRSVATQTWQVYKNPPHWEANQMYLDEMEHFLKCLTGEETPTLNVVEGAEVLKVALAAKTSAETERVIKVGDYDNGS